MSNLIDRFCRVCQGRTEHREIGGQIKCVPCDEHNTEKARHDFEEDMQNREEVNIDQEA